MKKIIKYIITIGIGLVIALIIANSKNIFSETNNKNIYHILSDSFFVPAIIITGFGLLIYVSNEGIFDGLTFAIMSFIQMFKKKLEKKYDSFYEYKERKKANKMPVKFVLISGLILMAIAIIMYILYASVA